MTDFIFALYICSWATCGDEPLSTHETLQECREMREEANKALAGGQFSICKRVGGDDRYER